MKKFEKLKKVIKKFPTKVVLKKKSCNRLLQKPVCTFSIALFLADKGQHRLNHLNAR